MRLCSLACFLLLIPGLTACQTDSIRLIPRPLSVETREGKFTLTAATQVFFPQGKPDWEMAARAFMALAEAGAGFRLEARPYQRALNPGGDQAVYFLPDDTVEHPEGYRLEVRTGSVVIRARSAAGAFYAVQTLRQLFPPEFNSPAPTQKSDWTAPCCTIADAPRFGYRGLHLDVARHFFPVDFIKKYIDLLAFHKLNTFHWHLTDDQGWRIEIKKYPRLQTAAACRDETLIGHYSDQPPRFDGKKYCGYYTQDEVRDIVEYARRRFVTIIPEIEMPGHSGAALAAYPELGCTGGPYETATTWGVFGEVFCAGNEQTFEFLDGVLEEVCALFPGPYVHVGGDECPKTRWAACPKCQRRKRDEGLKDEHELQSYFIRRAGAMLAKRGKKLIGWDEILEGGLAPSATVMSWRGTEGGIAAAREDHDVVMTPGSHCYFDYYQSDPASEPLAISGYTTLEKVYGYEPVPVELTPEEARHVLGAQANVWTEYIQTPDYVEYMAYPRVCAMSEVLWSARERRDWPDFTGRLKTHFARLDVLKVNYARSFFDVNASFSHGKVTLTTLDQAVQIHYTTDGTEPKDVSLLYNGPFALPRSTTVKAAAFQNGKKLGKTLVVAYHVHKASGKPYSLGKQPEQYTGGETYALTNGITGGLKTWNNWVALVNRDIDPVIDLGAPTDIRRVTTHFVNSKVSWIYPPRAIEVLVSDDGTAFRPVARRGFAADDMTGISLETVVLDTPGARGRYLKVVATTFGVIPAGAPGEGNGAWLFLDEIVVE